MSLGLVACGGPQGNGGGDPDAGLEGATLEVSPAAVELTVLNGAQQSQAYTATLRLVDDTTIDVTADAGFSVDQSMLGSFSDTTFTAYGQGGGIGTVTANYQGIYGQAKVTVNIEDVRVGAGVPAGAPGWFDAATDDPSRNPTIVYPSDTTLVPPNLGDFEVHWNDVGGNDLFEVRLSGDYVELTMYVTGTPSAGNWAAFLPADWAPLGNTLRGGIASAHVRAMSSTATTVAGRSAPITIRLADQEIEGGIYYWAAASSTGAPTGIYRHDMSRPGEAAEQFFTTAQSPNNRCVACHVISRDGTNMAVVYDGSGGSAATVDVATRTPYFAPGTYYWHFATYEPEGNRLLTAKNGLLTLRDPASGTVLSTLTTANPSTHPDFSPLRNEIAYVSHTTGDDIWFSDGTIMRRSFDPGSLTWGPEIPVVSGGGNNYYPSYTPDGEWILFNRSSEDAYSDASAELWITRVDGTVAPIKLALPDVSGGLTNSWPRWAPFQSTYGGSGGTPEKVFWLTFSSLRQFGVRMAAGTRPQVWMAPFFPERAQAGMEPSAPAFRLPFQDLTSNNHIAQWTEEVIPIQ
ncbi:MAG TPA: hypothetical protein VL172_10510 [Kofleriaceae bacterium]|nr:hypothetical protein [Kofleriaceae bacterium]